jgi:hypothetical protein
LPAAQHNQEAIMPHDRNGQALKVGDRVTVKGTVTSVSPGPDYCNITVETDEVMFPGTSRTSISLNARQVEFQHREVTDGSVAG